MGYEPLNARNARRHFPPESFSGIDDNDGVSFLTAKVPMILGPFSLEKMVRAVEKVRERLLRATAALELAQVPYAVVGGNAVAAWVTRVDESAVRNTQDVDILVRRADLETVKTALAGAGFHYRHSDGMDLFLDGPKAKARDAVHVIFAGEKVRPAELLPNPDVTERESAGPYKILSLRALVQIKLTTFRDKDRTHLRDLLDVGLIDATWVQHYPAELALKQAKVPRSVNCRRPFC